MSTPVVTVASGGLAIVEVAAGGFGLPVTEATNGFGIAVTKVVGKPGLPVVFDTIGVEAPLVPGTWNPADKSASMTLSSANLTATGGGSAAGVRAVRGVSSGKYYWENKWSTITGLNPCMGIGNSTAVLSGICATPLAVAIVYKAGNIWVNNVNMVTSLGVRVVNDVIGIAVNITTGQIWFRVAPVGNWNASGTANPVTGVGGMAVSALGVPLYPIFGVSGNVGTDAVTANFGASAFIGAVPSGFTPGWPT